MCEWVPVVDDQDVYAQVDLPNLTWCAYCSYCETAQPVKIERIGDGDKVNIVCAGCGVVVATARQLYPTEDRVEGD